MFSTSSCLDLVPWAVSSSVPLVWAVRPVSTDHIPNLENSLQLRGALVGQRWNNPLLAGFDNKQGAIYCSC